MTIRIGYVPYLNMVPFHQGFGPQPIELQGQAVIFRSCSPRALGMEAEAGRIDAGALSLVDYLRLSPEFEPIGNFGIGVRKAAKSVLLFSKKPLCEFRGLCAVTDDTATSVRLLQLLLEQRYGVPAVSYGRIASNLMYDGSADGLLLIGDEALRARKDGIGGLPCVIDLGEEWHAWHGVPFVFAQWAVRKSLPDGVKMALSKYLEKSLGSMEMHKEKSARSEADARGIPWKDILDYWNGFSFRLTPHHERSIRLFERATRHACLSA
jgi:chorismate dehydratase